MARIDYIGSIEFARLLLVAVAMSTAWAPILSAAAPLARGSTDRHVFGSKSEIEVEIFCPFDEIPTKGFVPLEIELRNRLGNDVEASVLCSFSHDTYGANSSFQSSYKIRAKQRATQTTTIIVPIPTYFSSSYRGYANLSGDVKIVIPGFGARTSYYRGSTNRPEILVCPKSTKIVPGETGSAIRVASQEIGALGFVSTRIPADWRAYTGFEVIACRATSWADIPVPSRRAIVDWVNLGGRLVIWDRSEIALEAPRQELKSLVQHAGLGKVTIAPAEDDAQAASLIRQAWSFHNSSLQNSLEDSFTPSNWPLLDSMGKRRFGTTIVVLVLIAFGILVGPVNLFSLAKSGRRHLLFITTPIISLATSILLAAFIFLQDGFGGNGKRFVLLQSAPDQNKVFISQEQASRTGVILNRAFEPTDPTWITHTALESSRWSYVHEGGSNNVRVSLNGGNFSGDWFRSRSEQAHFARSVVQSRERVELLQGSTPDSSRSPQLLSTFPCALNDVYFVGKGGTLWFAEELRSGVPATLVESKDDPKEKWQEASSPMSRYLRNTSDHVVPNFPEGFFFASARGEGVPSISAGPINWEISALVYGKVHTQ